MPNESSTIHVIGINTSSAESFFEAKKKPIFKAQRISGPQRILDSFKTWLKAKNIPDSEMMRTFNCGIGFCLIAPSKNLKKIKNSFSKESLIFCSIHFAFEKKLQLKRQMNFPPIFGTGARPHVTTSEMR